MEIKIKNFTEKSNFEADANFFKNKKITNSFNHINALVADRDLHVKNIFFENKIVGSIILCYPFKTLVEVKISTNSLHDLIRTIRKAYRWIYKDPDKYGIWGHTICDLSINSIKIYDNKFISVDIDS